MHSVLIYYAQLNKVGAQTMSLQSKIKHLVQKADRYAIWEDATDYFTQPYIVGYTAKGKRILRRVDRLFLTELQKVLIFT